MTTRYIRLPIAVDLADPSKCSEECPAYDTPSLPDGDDAVCRMPQFISHTEDDGAGNVEEFHFYVPRRVRHPGCIAAEETLS